MLKFYYRSAVLFSLIFIPINHSIADGKDKAIEITAAYLYGDIEGSVQTPAGGTPGSTSLGRPTLEELDMDSTDILELGISYAAGVHQWQAVYQFIRMDSSVELASDLSSQYHNFRAGEQVAASVQVDRLALNYLYQWREAQLLAKPITIYPAAGLVWFNFHYELDSATRNTQVDRSYSKVGYRAGVQVDWQLSEKLELQWQGFAGLPMPNTPLINSVAVNLRYQLWDSSNSRGTVMMAMEYNHIDYEDEQEVPNHIDVKIGPVAKIGLAFAF